MTPARPTRAGREALEKANREGELRRTWTPGPGKPPWPAPAVTLHALVRHGWLEQSQRRNRNGYVMDLWSLTEAGREVLTTPARVPKDTVHGMRAKGSARSLVMIGGVWTPVAMPEPEKVPARELDPKHRHQSMKEWWAAKDKRTSAAAHAKKLKAA